MDEECNLKREPNPRETAGLFSRMTFMYTLPIFLKGRKRDITKDDIYETMLRDKSNLLGDKAHKLWIAEIEKCKQNNKAPNMKTVLMKMNKFNIIKIFIGHMLNDIVIRPGQVIFLGYLISHYLDHTNSNDIPYLYVAGLLLSTLGSVFLIQTTLLEGFHTGMDFRIAASCLIYRKALKLNQSAFSETTIGQMVNLLSNDVGVFDRAIILFLVAITAPSQLIIFTILLYYEMGYSSFFGIGVLIVFIPLQSFLGKLSAKYRLKTALQTDARIRLMNEIIRGIEVIKMYAWEKSFAKLVAYHRRMEIKALTKSSYIKGSFLIYFIYISLPLFLTTLSYILFGNAIDARKIFFTTALFNISAFNMGTVFPQAVALMNEIKVSSDRIGKFLLLDEVTNNRSSTSKGAPIELIDVTAKWSKTMKNTLINLNVRVERGSLVAIVGPVGSGKTTLLQSILGETTLNSGNVLINGSISYSSQDPWIFNNSVRQNILFGNQMEEVRYKDVINACALAKDLKMFSAGDKTIVGEQGSVLSGGQKARVNLARAVYHKADTYLLDDPLSSVDVNVGKQIFDECICGFLKKKTVVLVTHQLQYLQQVDRIIVLEGGVIKADGTFEELQKLEISFVQLLSGHLKSFQLKPNYDSSIELSTDNPVEVEEQRSHGTVSISTYKDYIAACHSKGFVVVVMVLFISSQLLLSGSFFFMTYWVNFKQSLRYNTSNNLTQEVDTTEFRNDFIYTGLTVGLVITILLRNIISFNFCMRSARHLHDSMFDSIVRASMQFFNNNSSGRILNRFTQDMGVIDELLPLSMIVTVQTVLAIIGILIVTFIVNPWIVIPSISIIVVSFFLKSFYLSSSINIRRLESITKSPLFSHLHSTLQGLTTVRGFGVEEILKNDFDKKQDLHSCANILFITITRALAYWLDLLSFVYLTATTLITVFISSEIYGGNVGFVISQALQLSVQFQWGIKQLTDMENYMTSVERVVEYSSIDHERAFTNTKKPDSSWPAFGKIVFEKVYLSYISEELVLKNLNFTIQAEEKVGIVGRTGAGKSSVISAIFQLFEIDGKIIIDGVNIQEIGLHDLRKKISIIPQNPVLFAGTIRKNLDPFDECTDETLWKALEDVKMKETIEALNSGMQMVISEGGSNLSVGQRQLICLARAIIRNNKILILDEATANVDPRTDGLIQDTIRKKFSKCTVLTVAHRLQTIIDSDRILVLDDGEIVEFDNPHTLLQNHNGVFYKMVKHADKNIITDK